MAKKHLTEEQKKEIISSKLNNHQLADIYGCSHKTISSVRCRAGAGVGKESGGNYKLTKDQIQEIITSELGTVELAKKFSITPQHISKIKRKNGVARVKSEKVVKVKTEPKRRLRKVTPEMLLIICDPYLDVNEVMAKTGISKNRIWEIRKREKVRYIKTTVIIKEVNKPVNKHTDKVKLNASMTYEEQNYLLRKKASESSKQNMISDEEKIAQGYRWTVCDDRGIKCMKLLKPQ